MIRIMASRMVLAVSMLILAVPIVQPRATSAAAPAEVVGTQSGGERIWDRELDGRTEFLQMVGDDTVVRLSNRSVEAYAVETGDLIWNAARDGAGSVMISEAAGTPFIVLLHRFDRPPPTSGRAEGTSWQVSVYRRDAAGPVWESGPREGDALGCWPIPDHDRIIILVRNDGDSGSLFAVALRSGDFLWDVEYGELDEVPHGERAPSGRYFATDGERLFRVDRRERTVSLAAHDLSNGELKWVGYLQKEESDLRLTARDGHLYATGAMLTSIDLASGSVLWQLAEPWVPLDERMPWMLARHLDGSRLQLIHVNSGEERWRSPPRITAGPVSIVSWFPEGLLVGGERGATTLYAMVDANRISSERARYKASGRSDTEKIFALPDGLLFVRSGPKGNLVLRTDTRGDARWQTELSVPGPGTGGGGSEGAERFFSPPVGIEADGTGGSLWIAGSTGVERMVTRVDLQTGEEWESHALLRSEPIFVVSDVHSVIVFIAADGKLAAVRY